MAVGALWYADHKVVDGGDGKTPKIEDLQRQRRAKKVDPTGGIKTNVMNKAFTAAAKGGSVEKKPCTPCLKSKDGVHRGCPAARSEAEASEVGAKET